MSIFLWVLGVIGYFIIGGIVAAITEIYNCDIIEIAIFTWPIIVSITIITYIGIFIVNASMLIGEWIVSKFGIKS